MDYGGKDPVTGVFRELKSTEYRYKRPWNGILWWTIGNAENPMPPEYKSTLSDPYSVYSALVDLELVRPHETVPTAPPVVTESDVTPRLTRDDVITVIRDNPIVDKTITTAKATAQEIQMRVPWQGVVVVGAIVAGGVAYRFRGWIKRKLESIQFIRRRRRR